MKRFTLIRLLSVLFALAVAMQSFASTTVQVGDLISLSLPGEASLNIQLDVDDDGKLRLPEVGPLHVEGLTSESMQQRVKLALSQAYRDLDKLEVRLAEQRRLITVLGYVETPGKVTLGKGESLQSAFLKAGGLRAGAQLDKIQLRRGSERTIINYKRYLDSGDEDLFPSIQSRDVIFVPASPKIGNVESDFDPKNMADGGDAADDKKAIKVFGEVNAPGSFSYREGSTVIDYLMKAGGVTRYAGVEQIRVIKDGEPIRFDLKKYLDTGLKQFLPNISQGATLFIPRQEEAIKNGTTTVYVMGEVFHPGAYESNEGVSFMDILANAGGPTRFAESRQIRIIRPGGEVERFDLSAYTEGTSKQVIPMVSAGDAIFIPEKTDMNEKSWLKIAPDRAVRVLGEVVRPSRVEWSDEMNLLDLLAHVGGPTSRADTANMEVVTVAEDGSTTRSHFNLDQFLKDGRPDSELPLVRAGTTVRVHDLPQDPTDNKAQWVRQAADKSIYIMGAVQAPGRYMFTEEMGFIDILAAAEGPTENADLNNIRINHRNEGHVRVSQLDLYLYFETGDESIVPQVKPGDTIFIPSREKKWLEESKETTVRVLGEVKKPGRYTFNDTMTILDLLAEAGGTTGDANRKHIKVVNLSCCEDQAAEFNLRKFSKTGDYDMLPVIRAGDTVFVPNIRNSKGYRIRQGMRDAFELVTLGVLLGL